MDDADRSFHRGHVEVIPRLHRKRLHALCDWECRLDRFEVAREILGEVEAACMAPSMTGEAAASLRHAVGDALVRYLPKARVERVLGALREAGPHEAPVLARWLGWGGVVEGLREAMRRPCAERAAVLRALGQAGGSLPPEVREATDDPDPVVAQTAAIVALRRGDASVLERLAASSTGWSIDGSWRMLCATRKATSRGRRAAWGSRGRRCAEYGTRKRGSCARGARDRHGDEPPSGRPAATTAARSIIELRGLASLVDAASPCRPSGCRLELTTAGEGSGSMPR